MHLVGVAKAGQNQHFRPFRVPVEKARRPAFGVTSDLLGDFRRDRGHAIEGEAIGRSKAVGRRLGCEQTKPGGKGESQDEEA